MTQASPNNPATPLPATAAETPTPGCQRLSWWPKFPSTRQLALSLLAITALGAFLRFFRISYQCYWTDESYTVNRVHDSFDFMLAMLTAPRSGSELRFHPSASEDAR